MGNLSYLEEQGLGDLLGDGATMLADLAVWEDTPFRPSDDVVLLSFGFKYAGSQEYMTKVMEDGTVWRVDLTTAAPVWYENGTRIKRGFSYDAVVNKFGTKRIKNG